jgi:hypothetical protein
MDSINLHTLAGFLSTAIFITGTVPMLVKAAKTQDLKSYSFSHIALSNMGNLVHWVYVIHLPFGPIWFLHGFYTVATLCMLVWYLQYEGAAALVRWANEPFAARVLCNLPILAKRPVMQACACT